MRKSLTEKLSNLEGESCPEETSDCVQCQRLDKQTSGIIMACLGLIDRWLSLCSNKSHDCFTLSFKPPNETSSIVFYFLSRLKFYSHANGSVRLYLGTAVL